MFDDVKDFYEKSKQIINELLEKRITTLYLVMDGTRIGPYWPPSPDPHPQRQQKSPARMQTN